ncbi:hypothetical protein [Streptomyces sp. NPDC088801]|uniref:hypothetical protein n=1 Tax=Streptomyces sp. NPDC088801 TaxID=3365903 RepID=UPI0038269DB6
MSSTVETHVKPDWYPEEDRGGRSRGGGLRSPERYAEYTRVRRECPVAFSDTTETHAPLTRYADVSAAAVDTASAPLACLEMRVVLEEILARTTSIELAGEPQNDVGLLGGGFERVPVRLRSAAGRDN